VDEGIDTGDIISQIIVPVTPNDTYKTLMEKAIEACPVSICEAVNAIEEKTVVRKEQTKIHPVGSYFGQRRVGDEYIDWNWSTERVYNFIRAITIPGPGARTFVNGEKEIAVLEAKLIEDAPDYISTVGEVVGRSADGITIKTGTSTLLITSIMDVETSQIRRPMYKIGTRFLSQDR